MPLIPDLNPNVPGRALPVAPDVGTAMAPGRALQRVGSGISAVGETVGAFQLQMQKARDQGVKNKARLWMQEAYAQHEKFRLENPDETTWQGNLDGLMGGVRQRLDGEQLSPFAKEELDAEFAGWESNARSGLMVDATRHRVARDRTNETRLDELYRQSGDHASRRKLVDESPLWSESEKEVKRREIDFDEQEKSKADRFNSEKSKIAEDPDYTGFENHPDPEERQKLKSYRMQVKGMRDKEIVDSIRDGMASDQVTRIEQISGPNGDGKGGLGEDLTPRVRKILENELRNQSDDKFQQLRADPKYQAQVIGQVTAAMATLNPNNHEGAIELESLIRQLPEGPNRSHLTSQLTKKLKGEPDDMTVLNMNLMMAEDFYKSGGFGAVEAEKPQTVADVISDDFLRNPANMIGLGYSEDQAKEIANADSNEKRLAKFRDLFPERTGKTTADGYVQRAAQAIIERKDSVPPDPAEGGKLLASRHKARMALGSLKKHMIEWGEAHPNDVNDDAKVRAEMTRFLGPVRYESVMESAFDASLGVLPSREDMENPEELDLPEP